MLFFHMLSQVISPLPQFVLALATRHTASIYLFHYVMFARLVSPQVMHGSETLSTACTRVRLATFLLVDSFDMVLEVVFSKETCLILHAFWLLTVEPPRIGNTDFMCKRVAPHVFLCVKPLKAAWCFAAELSFFYRPVGLFMFARVHSWLTMNITKTNGGAYRKSQIR